MQVEKKAVSFASGNLTLSGQLCFPLPKNGYYGVLFLHGGGKYTHNLYIEWQEYLATQGYSSLSFYCRGSGSSEGSFSDSSLANRLKDAQAALEYFVGSGVTDPRTLAVFGSSMGGHVAVRLAEADKRVKALLLQSSAAYSQEAETVPLDSQFTQLIRQPRSWNHSPVFKILASYCYPVKVVYGEKDVVIPDEVKQCFMRAAKNTSSSILQGGEHRLLRPNNPSEEAAQKKLYEISVKFLNKNLG